MIQMPALSKTPVSPEPARVLTQSLVQPLTNVTMQEPAILKPDNAPTRISKTEAPVMIPISVRKPIPVNPALVQDQTQLSVRPKTNVMMQEPATLRQDNARTRINQITQAVTTDSSATRVKPVRQEVVLEEARRIARHSTINATPASVTNQVIPASLNRPMTAEAVTMVLPVRKRTFVPTEVVEE